jgi:poly(3-hydroxybutyrate) depolymerase
VENRIVFLAACAASLATVPFAQTTVTRTFTVNGTSHGCVWHAPGAMSKPPVVFFIHGANGSGGAFESETKGDAVADKEKFIAVYPSATSGGGAGTWADMQGATNFPFFLAVIDTLDVRYHIDRSRIYMTGFSQGGMISFVASCSYSDVFAAVAPVSGHSNATCALKRPVSVFMTFGTKDMGATSTFIADLSVWLKLDSCPSTPVITRPYPASSPSSGVTRITYGPCAQGTYVIADSIQGEGHQWPAADRLNQAQEVWAFFKQFSLRSATMIGRQAAAAVRNPITASYASGFVRLRGAEEECRTTVSDTRGRLISSAVVTRGRFVFREKPNGIYLVTIRENDGLSTLRIIIP